MEIFENLNNDHIKFIQKQKVFFVATAVADGRINLSPKGLDSLRVLNGNRIVWLNLTGSGNETAAHVQESSRMTLMMNAFEGKPLILRIYGEAKAVHHLDKEWSDLINLFLIRKVQDRFLIYRFLLFKLHVDGLSRNINLLKKEIF